MVEIVFGGLVVSRTRNLRGIGDYARKHKMFYRVGISPDDPCLMVVVFFNGATCAHRFADAEVLRQWVHARIMRGRGRVFDISPAYNRVKCGHCGHVHRGDSACPCFDNGSE